MRSRFSRSHDWIRESVRPHGWAGPNALQAVLLACLLVPMSCRAAVTTWTRWEQTLTSTVAYTNLDTVTLKVSYVGPDQRTMNGLGFWDGSNSFRIRCLFPEPGHWTWQTTCSDSSNAGLHNRSGSVEVTPYFGSNPLYRHGLLRVAENHRFLAHADSCEPRLHGPGWTKDLPAALRLGGRIVGARAGSRQVADGLTPGAWDRALRLVFRNGAQRDQNPSTDEHSGQPPLTAQPADARPVGVIGNIRNTLARINSSSPQPPLSRPMASMPARRAFGFDVFRQNL